MAKKEMQKKELNRQIGAALFSDTERMEMWFVEHWKSVVAVAVIVLVAGTATFGFWKYREYQYESAVDALRNAATVEALEQTLALYADCDAAVAARFRLANLLLQKKDYKNAAAQFQMIAKDPAASPDLAENARLMQIGSTELAGDLKLAAKEYAALGNDARISPARRAEADHAACRLLLDFGDVKAAEAILSKERLVGGSMMLAYWNGQLDALSLSIKNGDFKKAAQK
ncbi:MAG: hypothetical protein MJ033_06425 [Victivallaceae bacterium]|nr:hypothetical protein [Victivallaceae bacterium]